MTTTALASHTIHTTPQHAFTHSNKASPPPPGAPTCAVVSLDTPTTCVLRSAAAWAADPSTAAARGVVAAGEGACASRLLPVPVRLFEETVAASMLSYARLRIAAMTWGLVREKEPPEEKGEHWGLPRDCGCGRVKGGGCNHIWRLAATCNPNITCNVFECKRGGGAICCQSKGPELPRCARS